MDSDQPPSEASEDHQPPSTTTTEQPQQQHQQTTTQTSRSYECHFCKRGFTNAQALGGHMNIHRKDKTKFKPSTTVDSPSSTRPRLTPPSTTAPPLLSVPLPLFDHPVQRDVHQPGNPPLPEEVIDLELRLGHAEVEPPPESSSENTTTATRKFF